MGEKKPLWERPWVLSAAMAAVLAAGLGVGLGVGHWSGKPAKVVSQGPIEQAPAPVISSLPEDGPAMALGEESETESVEAGHPMIVPPPPRPGDGGVNSTGSDAEIMGSPALSSGNAIASLIQPPPVLPGGQSGGRSAIPDASPQLAMSIRPPGSPDLPIWQRYAVPAPKTNGRPMIAVIIDDLGLDKKRSERAVALRAPLTLAYMTYAEDLPRQTAAAHARGHELMVHVPMQPLNDTFDAGPDVLQVNMPPEEIRRRLDWGLNRFEGYIGINNHMGSRFSADSNGMGVVMEDLKRRGMAFVDSVTSDRSVGAATAQRYGVPYAARQVFLDNEQDVGQVRSQLALAEAYARKHGAAVAIGHPHDTTIEALAAWLPTLEARGFVLVPVSAIIRKGLVE